MELSQLDPGTSVHTCHHCQQLVATYGFLDLSDDLTTLVVGGTAPDDTLRCPLFLFFQDALAQYESSWSKDLTARKLGYLLRRAVGFGPTAVPFCKAMERCYYIRTGMPSLPQRDFFGRWMFHLPWFVEGDIKLFKRLAAADDPAAQEVPDRPQKPQMLNERTMREVKSWVSHCDLFHSCVRRPYAVGFNVRPPTRLLEVKSHEGTMIVRLVETRAVRYPLLVSQLRWCALSYCWGGKQHVVTTTRTYNDHLKGIPWNNLPATLQDAITVTSLLSIQYIWIDALCIVQDNERDKAAEIARMPDVYEHAWVTISASSAENCRQGFLAERTWEAICSVRYRCKDGQLGNVILSKEPYRQGQDPINLRGWTLQERTLSPRLLEFSTSQVRWRCAETFGHDGEEVVSKQGLVTGSGRYVRLDQEFAKLRLDSPFGARAYLDDLHVLRSVWARVIDEYSGRRLSVPGDKLLAVSSLATRLSELGGKFLGGYYAGLWEATLPGSLLWEPAPHGGKRFPAFVAPSWSWASFDGQVTNSSSESLWLFKQRNRIRFRRCVVTLAQDFAPFGAVTAASLYLKGRLVRGAVGEGGEDGAFRVYNVWLEYADDCVTGYLDEHCSRSAEENTNSSLRQPHIAAVWSLMVASSGKSWEGLLLERTDEHAERYRRVGHCHGSLRGKAERFWAEQPSRVIELI